jgi:phosphoribosylformylglycinamidine cyclo-ligase
MNYEEAGVSIERGDEFVERIKDKVKSTYGKRVNSGVGGFACLYEITEDKFLAAGTDGVGTKLKLAQTLNIHNTVGIDLVAMCANDIICTGATPLFFMDYIASGKLDVEVSELIVDGIVKACKECEMALIGGETAEMPGMYHNGEYDLAGFAVGEVYKKDVLDGTSLKSGDSIIALPSSGIHSNGFSLVRKIFDLEDASNTELLKECLTPTQLYVAPIKKIQKELNGTIKGLAHITGGGWRNIGRISNKFDYIINNLPQEIPSIFHKMQKKRNLGPSDWYETFNMGIGMVIITDKPGEVQDYLASIDEKSFHLGEVIEGTGKVLINPLDVTY